MIRVLFTLLAFLGWAIPCFTPTQGQSNVETHTFCAPRTTAIHLAIVKSASQLRLSESVMLVVEIQALRRLTNADVQLELSDGLWTQASTSYHFDSIDSGLVERIAVSATPIDSAFEKIAIHVSARTIGLLTGREEAASAYDEVGFFFDRKTLSFSLQTMEEAVTTEYRIWNLIPEEALRAQGKQITFDRSSDTNVIIATPSLPMFKRRPKLGHDGPYIIVTDEALKSVEQKGDTSIRTNPENLVCVTITGYIFYENSSGSYVALPNATVDIYDDDTFFDDYLGSTITNGSGYFSIHVCDDDGIFDTHLEIYAIFGTINSRVSVLNYTQPGGPNGFNPFAWQTWVIETGGGTISYGNLLISGSTMNRGGAKVFDNMQRAWSASVSRGFNPAYTPTVYPAPTSQCGGSSCYSFSGNSLGSIWIQPGEWLDGNEDVSYHEYGHALMHRAFASGWYPNTDGGSHTTFPQPAGFAWSEGWATFYTQVVQNDGAYFGLSLEDKAIIDIVYPTTGEVNEWRVAQAMTDLFDTNIDGDDYAQIPFIRFVNTMQSSNSGSLTQFWGQLRNSLSLSDRHLGYRSLTYNTISVAYEPPPPVAPIISGFTQSPVPIYRPQSGTVTCNISQGSDPITYSWTVQYVPSGVFVEFSGNRAFIDNGYRPFGPSSSPRSREGDDPMGIFSLSCTASNSAGSSTAGPFYPYLVYTPPPPPPGGCPFVYAWSDSGFIVDNNILPQSQQPDNEGHDVTDYYQMFVPPTLDEDRYFLAVGEFENEHSFLDQTKLLVIEHDPDAFITVDDSGTVIQFAKPAVFANAELDSTDVLKYLQTLDNVKVDVAENDTMKLWFTQDGGNYEQGLLLIGQIPRKEAIAGRIASQGNNRQNVSFTNFRLRRNPSYTWVLVGTLDTSTVQIDIEWKQDAAVDYSELSVMFGSFGTTQAT